MANTEVTVKYRSGWATAGLMVILALSPVWAVVTPLIALYCLLMTVFTMMFVLPFSGFVFAYCLGISYLGVKSFKLLRQSEIVIGSRGMKFPPLFSAALRGKLQRQWGDVSELKVVEGRRIQFAFQSGERIELALGNFDSSDLEKFVLALHAWASSCDREKGIAALVESMPGQGDGRALSYTALWENEFNRRFSSTCFVPLEPARALRDGRLVVVKQLAYGGLSAVYLARQPSGQLVVLKESVAGTSGSDKLREKALELFSREAQLLMKLNHPGIVKVLDHFVEDGRTYLMIEYIDGEDLRHRVSATGPAAESDVRDWCMQLVDILRYMHEQDPPVIHRDVTPDNLVVFFGKVVLIDFGVADEFATTATGTLVGKQSYMSPEQFRGKPVPASDIYSLGATMHFLLTGKEPEALLPSRPKAINAAVSAELDQLVADCTALEVEERIGLDELEQRLKASPQERARTKDGEQHVAVEV